MWFQALGVLCLFSLCHGHTLRQVPRPKGRAVGGHETKPNELPFLVAIEKDSRIMCGGSLMTESLVVTAAHCLFTEDGQLEPLPKLRVRAGEHQYSKEDGTEQLRGIKQIAVHEQYNPNTFINDIALIEVESLFQLSKFVKTIKLASSATEYYEFNCSTSGWGYTYSRTGLELSEEFDPTGIPDTPQVVQIDIIDKHRCIELHKKLKDFYIQAADSSSICAGNLVGGFDSCQGDSGGPLTCTAHGSGRPLLVGIVSSGIGCAQPNIPGLYTDVSQMHGWMLTAVKNLGQLRAT